MQWPQMLMGALWIPCVGLWCTDFCSESQRSHARRLREVMAMVTVGSVGLLCAEAVSAAACFLEKRIAL